VRKWSLSTLVVLGIVAAGITVQATEIELLSRVVYGALGGDSIFFYTIDKFYTSNYFCQSL